MKSIIRLETLATELLDEILTHLNTRDLNALARSCMSLYNQTQPRLYSSWAYHGRTHSRKSLRLFIRTVFTKPNLAAQVKTLDIGDWRYNALCGQKLWQVSPKWQALWELQQDEEDVQDIPLWYDVMKSYGFMDFWLEPPARFEKWANGKELQAEGLLMILLPKLPNVKKLYISMPDATIIQTLLEMSRGKAKILEHLETLYISPSYHDMFPHSRKYDGVKTPRNNRLGWGIWPPFLSLSHLRNFHILGIQGAGTKRCDEEHFGKNILDHLASSSDITILTIDAALCSPVAALNLVSVPRALRVFRLTGIFARHEKAVAGLAFSCLPPFYPALGKALEAHRDTLEELEVDVRWKGYGDEGKPTGRTPEPTDALWSMQEKHVIGSLTQLTYLKTLTILLEGLCVRGTWWERILDLLPRSLVELNLLFFISKDNRKIVEDMRWIREQLLDVIQHAREKLPILKTIEVVFIQADVVLEIEGSLLDIEEASLAKGILFKGSRHVGVENGWRGEEWMTSEDRFLDLSLTLPQDD